MYIVFPVSGLNSQERYIELAYSNTYTIELPVQLGHIDQKFKIFVTDKLATTFILACDYCDIHIDPTGPRLNLTTWTMGLGSLLFAILPNQITLRNFPRNSSLTSTKAVCLQRSR